MKRITQIKSRDLKSVISSLDSLSQVDKRDTDLFQRAFETSPIGVALMSPEGVFLQINTALAEMFGYTASTLKKKSFQDLTHPEDLDKDVSLYKKTLKGELDNYQIKKRYLHKDGHIIWALLSAAAIRDKDGTVQAYVSQIVDISENIQYEFELEQQRNEYQALTDNISDMISRHAADGSYLYVSPSCIQLLGYTPQEMIGTNAYKYFHPGDLLRIKAHHKADGENDGMNAAPIDYRIRHKNGKYIWVQTRSTGILVDGKLMSIIAVTRDMEETMKSVKLIEEKERQYRLLLNNLPLRVYYKDKQSIYQSCNALYAKDLGIEPDQIRGKTDTDLFPKELATKYHQDDEHVITTGKRFESIERYEINKQELRIHTIKVPISENKKIIGLLGIFWDISQEDLLQKENTKTIEKLQKMVRFFTNRELRMIELKKENEKLRLQLSSKR